MQTQRKQPRIRLELMDYEELIDLRNKLDKEIRARHKASRINLTDTNRCKTTIYVC